MTLVTTPGAADADSYASVADADAYFLARAITTWTGATAVKESALRRATAYLDNAYRERWVGIRTNPSQSLAWPRGDGSRGIWEASFLYPIYDIDQLPIDTTTVPIQIRNACIEAALLTLTGTTLEPTLVRGGAIHRKATRVGPLSKDIEYEPGATPLDRYLAIEGILRGLVTGSPGASSGNVRLVRA